MYFLSRDSLGRTFFNGTDRYIVKELFDQNEIHILQVETARATNTGWILMFNGTADEIKQKFNEILAKAKAYANANGIPCIIFYNEE